MAIADDDSDQKLKYDDAELLHMVRAERVLSIGFGEGDSGELTAARETALAYYKGDMVNVASEHKVASLENRSKAVDTTVADAVETIMPDLMEVFVGGDDVATFIPKGEADEDQARDESDFINDVVFHQNDGAMILYTVMKDALLVRTGVVTWYPEICEEAEPLGQVPADMAKAVEAAAEQSGMEIESEPQEDGSVTLSQTKTTLKVRIRAVPPEDFSVAADTVRLKDTTYCVMRDRPRVQDLIARGVDPEIARALKTYSLRNDRVELNRDEAGEHNKPIDGTAGDLRVVEVKAHYLRIDADDDGDIEIWRIVTDAEETVLIEKERIDQIPFAALTPFLIPHRFYGESVADKLIQVQQIKTALLRMFLDSGYFALNQRMYVDTSAANEFTLSDLLRNVPGSPIRGKGPGAVTPIEAGRLNFDPLSALEYASTMAESRSGIVRNAQGLNPDTLHDTATGAVALINAAQKRVRLIARIFAETGIKDMYLGVHAMLRQSFGDGFQPMTARLGSAWKQLKPSEWPERDAMSIHVGVGSAGKEHDLMVANQRLQLTQAAMQAPGAAALIDPKNIHAQLMAWERAAGSKDGDQFWSDPTTPEGQQKLQQQGQQPNPELMKAQADIQLKQTQAQSDLQLRQTQGQADLQLRQAQAQTDAQTDMARVQSEHALKTTQMDREFELKRFQLEQELQLERERLSAELQLKREAMLVSAQSKHAIGMSNVSVDDVEPGGEPG